MIELKKNNFFFDEEVDAYLHNIIKNKSFTNGYLFCGAEGVGKKQTALRFIKEIFKQSSTSGNIEESIFRRKNEIPDRMESEGIKFLEKVSEGFKIIAKQKNWTVISASQNIKTISNQIKETVLNNFSDKND